MGARVLLLRRQASRDKQQGRYDQTRNPGFNHNTLSPSSITITSLLLTLVDSAVAVAAAVVAAGSFRPLHPANRNLRTSRGSFPKLPDRPPRVPGHQHPPPRTHIY